jgi:hypothetical protein
MLFNEHAFTVATKGSERSLFVYGDRSSFRPHHLSSFFASRLFVVICGIVFISIFVIHPVIYFSFLQYLIYTFFFFFLYGAAAHIGSWPPLYEIP